MKRLTSLVVLGTAALLISPSLYAQRGMSGRGGGGGSFHSGGGFRSGPSGGFRSGGLQDFIPLPADSDQAPASAPLVRGLPAFHRLLHRTGHFHRGFICIQRTCVRKPSFCKPSFRLSPLS